MEISKYLNGDFFKIEYKNSVTSTNDIVKEYAKSGENEGLVLIANAQSAGKGRLSRSFYSPENTGVYLSILLRPKVEIEKFTVLTPLSAVAVCRATQKVFGVHSEIKWVNDVYCHSKKVCGILTESGYDIVDNSPFAVVGIGVNVAAPKGDFPLDIKDKAGAICDSCDREIKAKFTAEILNEFYNFYRDFETKSFYSEYKNRSFVLGKKISFIKNKNEINAVAEDIDDNFGLIVKTENGEILTLSTGEVSIKL